MKPSFYLILIFFTVVYSFQEFPRYMVYKPKDQQLMLIYLRRMIYEKWKDNHNTYSGVVAYRFYKDTGITKTMLTIIEKELEKRGFLFNENVYHEYNFPQCAGVEFYRGLKPKSE